MIVKAAGGGAVGLAINHAITSDARAFGMAEAVRLFRIACGDLK